MKQRVRKEQIITQVLDEYLIKKRAGEAPTLEEYTKRYPEYAADIRKAFAEEIDWMSKFSTIAEKIEITS